MKILITGKGNIANIIHNNLKEHKITIYNENLLNFEKLKNFLNNYSFDVLIHCAIKGGRRTKEDTPDIVYNNILMFENILSCFDKFKIIINLDSGAVYDRTTDIFNRKENELKYRPKDYYGFSKYIIYKCSLNYDNVYNLRLFNIFHINEEPDRFIKQCFISNKYKTPLIIKNDKYFDFVSELDFIKIIRYYLENKINYKVINVSYENKYKLSDIANLIIKDKNLIQIESNCQLNYCGNGDLLKSLNIELMGLDVSLNNYSQLYLNCSQN